MSNWNSPEALAYETYHIVTDDTLHPFVLTSDIQTEYWLVVVKLGRDWVCVNEKAELYIEQSNFKYVTWWVHKKQGDSKITKRPAPFDVALNISRASEIITNTITIPAKIVLNDEIWDSDSGIEEDSGFMRYRGVSPGKYLQKHFLLLCMVQLQNRCIRILHIFVNLSLFV